MKSLGTPIFFLCLALLFASCKRDVITYYTTDISLSHYDNAGAYIKPASDTVDDSCYVLRINYTSDQTAYYAVDDRNTYAPANQPTSITITSLQAFDPGHPAGSSLNEYFIAGPGMRSTAEDVISNFMLTQDYYPTHDPDDLWLMQPPATPGSYRFVVEMDFDNAITVRDTTTPVILAQ